MSRGVLLLHGSERAQSLQCASVLTRLAKAVACSRTGTRQAAFLGSLLEWHCMTTVACSIDIATSAERVFDLLHDYDQRLAWDPFLKHAEVLGNATAAGKGVHTLCVARNAVGGMGMETVYVSFERPDVAAVKMTRGPWFLNTFAASIRQKVLDETTTRVIYKFHLESWPRWCSSLVEPILTRVFRRETTRRLQALQTYLEEI